MKRICIYILLFSLLPLANLLAQGKIMLVGGGGEKEGGWSDAPYTWAITESGNQRVAIISYEDQDNALPNYFLSLGAAAADNIKIGSREDAGLQATYDDLMAYDVFFFKGGDQYFYYTYYKGTKTEQAIEDKYAEGGVIAGTSAGMAIISEVMFTAENGTIYPDQALENINSSQMTLANDFLDFMPGFIVDTHFVERGRFSRLIAFMAHWQLQTGESLHGIGVDDQTAFCINDNVGTVYGTAAINLYKSATFSEDADKMVVNGLEVVSAVHGQQISLTDLSATGYEATSNTAALSESGNHVVLISGDNAASENDALIESFVNEFGNASDDAVIVTASSGNTAAFGSALSAKGIGATVINTNEAAGSSASVAALISNSNKFLFAGNDPDEMVNFLATSNGAALTDKIKSPTAVSAFAGIDGDLAGATFVPNIESDESAAFSGNAELATGLGALSASMVVSRAFSEETEPVFENKAALLPYGVVKENLRYGFWVNPGSMVKMFTEGGKRKAVSEGTRPVIFFNNEDAQYRFADQLNPPRHVVGTQGATLSYLKAGEALALGDANSDPCEGVVVNANFSMAPSSGIAQTGEEVLFFNQSDNETTVSWDFGNGTVATDENPVTVYTTAGEYTIVLTATGDCGTDTFSRTIQVEGATVLGLPSFSAEGIQCYPNPAADKLSVRWGSQNYQLTILDLQGKVQHQSTHTSQSETPVNGFSAGFYILKVTSRASGSSYQQKLIVQP